MTQSERGQACIAVYRAVYTAEPIRAEKRALDRVHLQADQPSLKVVFKEYPFLPLSPFNILLQHIDLNLMAIRDGVETVEESSDCGLRLLGSLK